MSPCAAMDGTCSDNTAAHKPDLSYLPTFNVAGGRPTERCGTRGTFTRGVRIMSGGPSRDVPLDAEVADHGKVLFVSSACKPDLSGEARTNAVRPTERLGSRGGFTPGSKAFLGGRPRDVPFARVRDPGTVIFQSSTLPQPDLSAIVAGETNVVGGRGGERRGRIGSFEHGVVTASGGPSNVVGRSTGPLSSHGGFTPGAKAFLGGAPRDVPLARLRNPGTVIFQSLTLPQPDLSAIVAGETNVAGGRGDERRGRIGSFEHGVVTAAGGPRGAPSNYAREAELYRRCAPIHLVTGESILPGVMPSY